MDWLAIGIGVNLAETPDVPDAVGFPPISVAEVTGDTPRQSDFLTLLAGHYATQEMVLGAAWL